MTERPRSAIPNPLIDAASSGTVSRVSKATKRVRRVLVVDDSDDTRDLYHAILAQDGHDVTFAQDGESGLALLTAAAFDVAIIDIGLPALDGYEIARRAHAALGARRPALVAVTGYARAADREAAARAGFDVHIAKPIDHEVLLEAVQRDFAR
jgi:CheY-like chemotaxis protein